MLKRGPLADHHRRRKLFIFGWRSPCPILNLCSVTIGFAYTVVLANSIGSAIEGSSFSGLLTRVEIGPHSHWFGGDPRERPQWKLAPS